MFSLPNTFVCASYDETEPTSFISEEFTKQSSVNIVDNAVVAVVASDYGGQPLNAHARFELTGHLGVDIVISMNWIGLWRAYNVDACPVFTSECNVYCTKMIWISVTFVESLQTAMPMWVI
ncbi:hypothetical protein BV22DRAFT_1050431 [Leucogyrophana mollusca]|uniref:Uncharacterized protein n=1 Tax=Leucogyrophana mollusca TaxID=85980 RepID=A0ACB8B560_9AGAM|nr:hypothetical protein BV22DRAFT_1050431 [Leucogyrophana mollusca]